MIILLSFPDFLTAQYVQTNGPYGGRVNCVASTNQVVFAGTEGGGVFKTFNQGQNWIPANNGITARFIRAIVVFGNNALVSCAPDGFGGQNAELFYSSDLGTTWYPCTGASFSSCNAFYVDSNDVYAGTEDGLFISQDNGENWDIVSSDLSGIPVNSITKKDSTFYVGTSSGVYISSNGINTWTPFNYGLPDLNIICIISKGTDLYIINHSYLVYVSHDFGQSWNNLNSLYAICLFVKDNRLYYGYDGVYYSDDDAQTWTRSTLNSNVHSITYDGNNLYAGAWEGTYNGVSVSADSGNTWSRINNGIIASNAYTLLRVGNRFLAGSFDDGMFVSDDGANNWIEKNSGLTDYTVFALHKNDNLIYNGTFGGGIFVSTDSAETWQQMIYQPPDSFVFECNLQGPKICAFCYHGNFFSADSGLTWDTITDLPNLQLRNLFNFNNRLFTMPIGSGLYYSDDAGASWTSPAGNILVGNFYALSETDYGLFAGGDSGLYLSVDNGLNWNLIQPYGNWNGYITLNHQFYAIKYNADLFISNDTGAIFLPIYFTTIQHQLWNYILNGNELIISLFAEGIWKMDVSGFMNTKEIPKAEALVFPNPFSNEITILLPLTDKIENITISDIAGRVVENIHSPKQITFNTEQLKNGLYILTIETVNGEIISKKIICNK